jgi:hypothetical protein
MHNHNKDFLCFNFYQQGFLPNSENSEYLQYSTVQYSTVQYSIVTVDIR